MSDFVAQIQAVLDTSKAEAQLKDLEKNQKIKLDVDDSKIEEAQKKLKDISKDKQKIKLDVDVNKSAQKEIDKTIEQATKHTKKNPLEVEVAYKESKTNSISKLTDNANKLFSLFSGGNNALDASIDKVREAIGQLKELNSTLVEIDKTGNLSQTQLSDLANNSYDLASKWGALVKDYLSSSETFSQAGYSNLEEMADLSTIAQTAGQMTEKTATNFLIASDSAWQMKGNVEKLTSVLDGMNSVTNHNAMQMTELANGIRVAGSMLANSGLTEDQATALVGTGVATTKEAGETVARGLRTIIMNLRQVQGMTDDGEIIDAESLKKVESTCNDVGVSLKTVKDGMVELRNPIDILRELSEVYNSLDILDVRRAKITDDIAGKHRSNILASILTNFDQYDKQLQDYANGEGSAMREALKTSESWAGRLNSLSNSWLEFVNNFVQADTMKGGISFLDNMISAFDTLQDKQLFIPTMISSIMALRNLFTGKGITDIGFDKDGKGLDIKGDFLGIDFTKLGEQKKYFKDAEAAIEDWNIQCLMGRTSVKKFDNAFKKDNKDFKKYISTVKDGSASLEGYKEHLKSTGVEFEKAFNPKSFLTNAAVGFLASAGIELALAGITKIADELIYKQDHLKEKVDSSATAYSSTVSEIQSINSELSTTQARIDELKSQDKLLPGDEAELAELERKNALLETQLNTKKQLADTQAIEAAEAAKESINYASQKSLDTHMDRNGIDISKSINRKEYIRELVAEMEEAQKRIDDAQAKLADDKLSKKDRKLYEGQFDSARESLEKYKSEATELLAELNVETENFYDKQTGEIIKGFEKEVKENLEINDLVSGFNLSPIEKQVKQIESYFNGSKVSNNLKDQLLEAAKSGKSATDALHEMGITLNDLGITGDGKKAVFDDYFSGLVESAQEAQEAINSIDGSVDGVKKAFESENQDADWNSMAEYLKQAEEMYAKTGKVGTDDFKAAVQFISPDIINPDAEGFKYDADAYVAAWENAREKVKRYFDSENPITSATNFTNDLIDKNLASKAGDDITWGFETSAEAAKALGISVEATEVAMRNLESYGAEFDDVMFSGEGLKRYENALDGIKSLRDSMKEGESKNKLSELIGNWDNELAGYQADLSTLTEDQIIKIEFQYDLASIRSEIEELKHEMTDGGTTEQWGSLNAKQESYREKVSSQEGMEQATSDSGYQNTLDTVSKINEVLRSNYDMGEGQRKELQVQKNALLEMQNAYLDAFSNGQTANWEEFFNSDGFNSTISQLSEQTGLAEDKIKKLFEADAEKLFKVDVDTSKAESKIDGVMSNDGKTIIMNVDASVEQVQAQLETLQSGQKLLFTAEVNGEVRGIEAIRNTDGTITYTTNVNGVKQEITPVLNQDGTVNYTLGESPEEVPNAEGEADFTLGKHPETAPPIDGKANYSGSFPDSAPTLQGRVVYKADFSSVNAGGIASTVANIGKSIGGGKANGTLLPAHANGTGYNVLNYRPAYSDGKISLSQDEEALVNELGTESIIRNGKWMLLPGGMHVQSLKKGDIVLTAEQTRDLLNTGRTNGHARAYAEGTLGSAYANGWRLPSAVTNNTSSSKKKPSKKPSTSSKSNTSSNSSDSAEKAEEFKETIDYIEMKIDRIERQIKNLERVAGSAYNTFSKRNTALRNQISSITEEISTQQAGYDRYIQQANSVSLSENYKSQVRDGAIDISTITDEELAKNIKEYQEWYEKALDCRDAVEELRESVRDLYAEAFDNIVTLYDGILGQLEHRQNILEGYIDQAEAQGYIISTKYYDALISNELNKLDDLTKERQDLINSMNDAITNGNIEEGSEQWYEFQSEINDVNEAIQEANTSLIEFGNSIRDIEWEIFDKIQDRISGITDESDFLVKLLSSNKLFDDKGLITDEGKATMGLHGVNYNTYMSQADEYRKEMEKIQSELSKDPHNQTLVDRRKELLELQQESILAAEDEKEAIKNLVEDGINKQLESLQELINKYNDMMDAQKDMYDYQKEIEEKQKKINEAEKQLASFQGDDSEEGAATRQELKNELNELKADLEETQYQKSIAEQKKLLDELYTEYETVLNLRLDNIDLLIMDIIGNVNSESSSIRDTIVSEAESVGYKITDSMSTIWTDSTNKLTGVITTYGDKFTSSLTGVQTAINDLKNLIQQAVNASNETANKNIDNTDKQQTEQTSKPTPPPAPAPKPSTPINIGDGVPSVGDAVTFANGKYFYSSDGKAPNGSQMLGKTVYITKINNASWAKKPYHISKGSSLGANDLGWVSLDQLRGYKNGTESVDKDQWAWTNEDNQPETVVRKSDGAILTRVHRGDQIYNNESTKNLWHLVNNPGDYIKRFYPNAPSAEALQPVIHERPATTIQNEIHLNVNVDHVQDYNDLLRQMRNDPKFERLVQTLTLYPISGSLRSTFAKYSIHI